MVAERGFDPRTSGLWAQHASTAPLCSQQSAYCLLLVSKWCTNILFFVLYFVPLHLNEWSHGVMVSTLDFESSDPSSNLGGTSFYIQILPHFILK